MIFGKIPLSPNQWTVLSLVPAIVAAYFLARQEFLISASFFALAGFIDFIDGSVARVKGRVTKFGGYLDTVIDRYVEGVMILALLFLPFPNVMLPAVIWIFLYLFGSMFTTYVKSAAKEKELIGEGQELKGGLIERPERLALLFVGILAATVDIALLLDIVIVLAILTNISALQRIWKARQIAKRK
jgi:phosphatidylglycerophosphate synthase